MYIYKSKFENSVFLKNSENPLAAKYIDEINSACYNFKGKPIHSLKFSKFRIYDEIGERAVYQKDYFENRRRLTMYLLRVWLFREEDDIKELEDILWAVCDEYTWALPAHLRGITTDENRVPNVVDLFAAETAHTIAEALSLCGELLHPAVVKRCVGEVFKRVIEPFETHDSDKYYLWWENGTNNWSAVCGGAVGMIAIYLIEDKTRLNRIITCAKNACNRFFDSCSEDGVCKEGISYWMYAMQYYVAFDELLKEYAGESMVNNQEKMRRIAEFPSVACITDDVTVKFSDFGDKHLFFGIMCKLNERYCVNVPEQSYYEHILDRCARTCGAVRTIAWFNPELLCCQKEAQDVFLPDAQWAILHFEDMIAAVKGGNNDEPHNHNDIGSYMYVKAGEIIADELGAAKYTKTYFSSERYTFLNADSRGHSLPIINGYKQCEGKQYAADKFEKTDSGVRISFANAYDKEAKLKTLVRDLKLNENGGQIKDSFEFNRQTNSVTERIITKSDATVISENEVSILKDGEIVAMIEFSSGGKINIARDSYYMPNSSGRSDEYGSEDGEQAITIIEFECFTNSDNMEISYIIK